MHGHGGITVEHLKALALHHDLVAGDRFFWFTTTGWMMWNYLVSGLMVGATIVLFDGDPASPDLGALWQARVGDRHRTCSARAHRSSWRAARPACRADRRTSSARSARPARPCRPTASAGSTTSSAADVQTVSVSGGTDVCTAFVGGVAALPVRAGEITCRLLGCAVEAFAPDGTACPPGRAGRARASPRRCRRCRSGSGATPTARGCAATYFGDYPGVWRHGDWITFTDDGVVRDLGRSDATLNRGGVRLGTSDFYAVVEGFARGRRQPRRAPRGHRSRPPHGRAAPVRAARRREPSSTTTCVRGWSRELRTELSPRHVPDAIVAVPAVPRTLSGKKLEVPVKRILGGASADEVASRSSLTDPTALDWFEEHAVTR